MTAQTFSSDLLLALHKLYLEKIGCDVIVSAESCNLIPAHRVVLIAGSGYFRTILIKSQPNDLGNDVVCLPPSMHYLTTKYLCRNYLDDFMLVLFHLSQIFLTSTATFRLQALFTFNLICSKIMFEYCITYSLNCTILQND